MPYAHSLFIDRDGRLLRCGDDPDGDCTPRVFSSLGDVRFLSVSCNKWFSLGLVLSEEGVVYSLDLSDVDSSDVESLSHVDESDVSSIANQELQIVPGLGAINVRGIAAGAYHCAALTADGALYTWAYWDAGPLPLGLGYEIDADHFSALTPRLPKTCAGGAGRSARSLRSSWLWLHPRSKPEGTTFLVWRWNTGVPWPWQ